MQLIIALVIAICLFPTMTLAAIAELTGQRATATQCLNSDSCAVAYPGNVTSGDLLVVGGNTYDTGGTTGYTVTDTVGTSYTVFNCTALTGNPNATPFIAVGVAAATGANTVTVNPTLDASANEIIFGIGEFSGTATAGILDVDGGSSTGSSTTPSDGLTTITANSVILGLVGFQTSSTVTPGGSYTEISESQGSLNGFNFVNRMATTAQAYTVDWTLGTTQAWSACTVSIKPLSSARRRMAPLVFQ